MTSLIFKLHNYRKFAVITFFDLTAEQKVYENIRDEGSSFKAFLVISAENVLAIIEMDCAQGFPLFLLLSTPSFKNASILHRIPLPRVPPSPFHE